MDGFRACLERHCGRVVRLVPAVMEPGASSALWLRTAGAHYFYYEAQTSPFHQAYIVLHLAARMLLSKEAGTAVDLRLVPDVSPQLISLMLGDDAQHAVTDGEADAFAFQVLGQKPYGLLARRRLRQLRPLRNALLDAVPEATYATAPGLRTSARYRLYQAVIEIRDAMLALRPYRDRQVAMGAAAAARAAGLIGDDLAAAVEGAVLAHAVRARKGNRRSDSEPAAYGLAPAVGPDLRSEAAWLVKVSRAHAEYALADRQTVTGQPVARRKVPRRLPT